MRCPLCSLWDHTIYVVSQSKLHLVMANLCLARQKPSHAALCLSTAVLWGGHKARKKPIPWVVKVWIKGERCREKGSLTLTLCVHITSDHAMINRSTGAMDKGLLQLTKVIRSSCRLQLPGPSSSAASSAPMASICNIRQSR